MLFIIIILFYYLFILKNVIIIFLILSRVIEAFGVISKCFNFKFQFFSILNEKTFDRLQKNDIAA